MPVVQIAFVQTVLYKRIIAVATPRNGLRGGDILFKVRSQPAGWASKQAADRVSREVTLNIDKKNTNVCLVITLRRSIIEAVTKHVHRTNVDERETAGEKAIIVL